MQQRPLPHTPAQAFVIALVMLGFQMIGGTIIGLISVAIGLTTGVRDLNLIYHPAMLGALNLAVIGLIARWIHRRSGIPSRTFFRWHLTQPRLLLPALLLTLGSVTVVSQLDNYIIDWLPNSEKWLEMFAALDPRAFPISAAITLVIIAPLTEEVLFRGIMLNGLLGHRSFRTSLIVTTLLFAFIHLNPLQFAGTISLGLVAGWFFARTGSLLLPALAHATQGIELLTEEQYRELQKLGEFDTKTSSWVQTPAEIRKLGGALFCDRRYDHVFVYHNGAQSYYAARAFRGSLRV